MTDHPLVRLRNLAVAYGPDPVPALGPLDLDIGGHEALGVLGESGAGKSTIALELLGLLALKGARRISGEGEYRIDRRRIGYIPQDPLSALDPLFSVGSQLAEGGAGPEEIREALERVHLPLRSFSLQSYPHELSGGMRQRIVIAMALLHKPALLIADEPTSSLDMTLQAGIMKLFREIHVSGIPFVFISHNIPLAANFCDRLVIMRKGKIVETGTPEQIMERPADAYTRGLIASLPRFQP